MKTSEILIKAKSLIDTPDKWLTEEYADGEGCFCSLGAIAFAEANTDNYSEVAFTKNWENDRPALLLNKAVNRNDHCEETFATYNDHSSHEQVMTAFDKAIQLALEEESKDAN